MSFKPAQSWNLLFQYDMGFQNRTGGVSQWNGWTAVAKYQLSEAFAAVARVEDYNDPDQVIVTTQTAHGFQTTSASLGIDEAVTPNMTWRSEYRQYWTKDSIYPSRDGLVNKDALAVTSLSASF